MGALLRLVLVVAHLAVAGVPCPPARADVAAEPVTELRAFCPCGCDGAPPAARSLELGAALVPAAERPALPRLALAEAPCCAARSAWARTPEPVPRQPA